MPAMSRVARVPDMAMERGSAVSTELSKLRVELMTTVQVRPPMTTGRMI